MPSHYISSMHSNNTALTMRRYSCEVHMHMAATFSNSMFNTVRHVFKLPITVVPTTLMHNIRMWARCRNSYRCWTWGQLSFSHFCSCLFVHSCSLFFPRLFFTCWQVTPLRSKCLPQCISQHKPISDTCLLSDTPTGLSSSWPN